MNKGLDVLNYLKHRFEIARTNQTELDIIEKDLQALEILKKYFYGNGILFGEMTPEELHFIREVMNS